MQHVTNAATKLSYSKRAQHINNNTVNDPSVSDRHQQRNLPVMTTDNDDIQHDIDIHRVTAQSQPITTNCNQIV